MRKTGFFFLLVMLICGLAAQSATSPAAASATVPTNGTNAMNAMNAMNSQNMQSIQYVQTGPVTIDSTTTLIAIADAKHVPIKKLLETLHLPMTTSYGATPKDLHLTLGDVLAAVERIHATRLDFGGNLTLLGMSVTFTALALVAVILLQLPRLSRKPKKQPTPAKMPPKVHGDDAAVAALLALHIHIQETQERNKLLLTWRRAPISMWKAATIVEMPNRDYYEKRG